ncbi:WxL domain-containing protein [Enterococcus innesii]|uniref:WxL domain-containing protein n=1 Tax=Enterococcus innesii TaxID=2839759 RepID=UPI0022B9BFAC|nr:WxL domain-containing protein [Enterococcus innesii]
MKGLSFKVLTIFFIFTFFLPIAQLSTSYVFATTKEAVNDTDVEKFKINNLDFLCPEEERHLSQEMPEMLQEFSFVAKTFRTTTNQPVLIKFTSTIATTDVLVRVPEYGQILNSEFSKDEHIHHSHGEYWLLKTPIPQTTFELAVLFEQSGSYFLTVGHDADHFYLEVKDEPETLEQPIFEKDYLEESELERVVEEIPEVLQPEVAKEENISIPASIIAEEELRIYEETLDPETRSTSNVNNWSQFRSAWNNSGTSIIIMTNSITYSGSLLGSNLNARNSSIVIQNARQWRLDFSGSNNNLVMNGNNKLTVHNVSLFGGSLHLGHIRHLGSGVVEASKISSPGFGSVNSTVIEAQNIVLNDDFHLVSSSNSSISLVRNGTLIINNPSERSIIGTGGGGQKPITSTASSRIIINDVNRMTMGTMGHSITPRSSWSKVNVTLTGVNGAQVLSSSSDQEDFEERYTQLFNETWYNALIFNGTDAEFVPPIQIGTVKATYTDTKGNTLAPSEVLTGTVGELYSTQAKELEYWSLSEVPSNANGIFTRELITVDYIYERIHKLSFQTNPSTGGSPIAEKKSLISQEETVIHAKPNEGYRFEVWEIIDGDGANINNITSETTVFVMGNSDVVIQAVYVEEPKTTVPVNPTDPLAPEIEVNPENKPDLPEDQGPLSIDFISAFSFGTQAISVNEQIYFGKTQRLLNGDGTLNETEERPNYIQISDRRPENERHGWQLAVTQKEQFRGEEDQELFGASLSLLNQQIITAQGGTAPELQSVPCVLLIPGNRRTLLKATENDGTGTWIYRFGDADTQGESVSLTVPKGSTPESTTYSATLVWELSAVPEK